MTVGRFSGAKSSRRAGFFIFPPVPGCESLCDFFHVRVRLFGWFKALMPKEERFFVLLVRGAEALKAVLAGGDALAHNCARPCNADGALPTIRR